MKEGGATRRRVHLFLKQDQHRAIETLAELAERTAAEVTRDAIDLGLARLWEAASEQRWVATQEAKHMSNEEAAHAYRLQQAARFFDGAGLIHNLENGNWFKAAGAETAEARAMADLREAYPRWTLEELERYRRNYEQACQEERDTEPFDEHARRVRDYRQALRDRGVPVDDPPHPESQLILEYDPPLAQCPNGCYGAGFLHMDAPSDPEQKEKWRQDGFPGRRQCLKCSEIFVASKVPGGRPRLSGVRLESYEEVLRRKKAEGRHHLD